MVLHEGSIAEMKTGEGKTLVATLPTYLNALTGKGVHVVTVNDYLAERDGNWYDAFPCLAVVADSPAMSKLDCAPATDSPVSCNSSYTT